MANPTFNEVLSKPLRTWNRAAMSFNLLSQQGALATKKYLNQFSQEDKADVYALFELIKTQGYERTRAAINKMVETQ